MLSGSLVAAVALIGCGGGGGNGGGGGGGGTLDCGSAAGSTTPVVCGRIVASDAARTPVDSANVTLRDINGNILMTVATDALGKFKFNNVPANAVLFRVDPPTPAYHLGIASFRSNLYNLNGTANAGGPCLPSVTTAVGSAPAGDTLLPDVTVYQASGPPPPPFGCPR